MVIKRLKVRCVYSSLFFKSQPEHVVLKFAFSSINACALQALLRLAASCAWSRQLRLGLSRVPNSRAGTPATNTTSSGASARRCAGFHRACIPCFWVSTFTEFLSYFRGKILTFFSYKRRTGRLKDINRGPRGPEQQPTLWLRSVTPADLKSGNLMPAVSGTAWKRSKQDVLMEETRNTGLDRDAIWRGNTVSYDREPPAVATCQSWGKRKIPSKLTEKSTPIIDIFRKLKHFAGLF